MPDAKINEVYSYDLNTAIVDGTAVSSYSETSGIFPSNGLTFDTSTGILSGTPTPTSEEVILGITFTVTNNAGTSNESTAADLTVLPALQVPTISGIFNMPDTSAGRQFDSDVSTLVTGGDAATGWTLTGTPPTNAVIDSAGLITGLAIEESRGANSYGVQAFNNAGPSVDILTDADGINIGPNTDLTADFIPISEGTLDSEQLNGSTQPDLVVSGTISDGSAVTVSSTTLTLPSVSPNIIIYDDFSGKVVGVQQTLDATIGTWSSMRQTSGAPYVSGGRQNDACMGAGSAYLSGNIYQSLQLDFVGGTEIFTCYSYACTQWPGTPTPAAGEFPDDSCFKMAWFDTGGTGGGDNSDMCLPSYVNYQNVLLAGNSHNVGGPSMEPFEFMYDFNSWNTLQVWIKDNPSDPQGNTATAEYSITNAKGSQVLSTNNGRMFTAADISPTLKSTNFPGWMRVNNIDDAKYSDIYVADNPVRAMVGNGPSIDQCTVLAVQTTSNHTSISFDMIVRMGGLTLADDILFLYVYDETNTLVNTVGKRLN